MAVTALFNTDVASIKSQLRLSGTASNNGQALIDNAIQLARIRLYDALGVSRVNATLAFALTDNPTSANDVMRLKAAKAELLIVKSILLRDMPVLFYDEGAKDLRTWNEEGLTRDADRDDLADELTRLESEIADLIDGLRGESPEGSILNVSTIGPDEVPDRPGASIATRVRL